MQYFVIQNLYIKLIKTFFQIKLISKNGVTFNRILKVLNIMFVVFYLYIL